jgi:hypothetical protein
MVSSGRKCGKRVGLSDARRFRAPSFTHTEEEPTGDGDGCCKSAVKAIFEGETEGGLDEHKKKHIRANMTGVNAADRRLYRTSQDSEGDRS